MKGRRGFHNNGFIEALRKEGYNVAHFYQKIGGGFISTEMYLIQPAGNNTGWLTGTQLGSMSGLDMAQAGACFVEVQSVSAPFSG